MSVTRHSASVFLLLFVLGSALWLLDSCPKCAASRETIGPAAEGEAPSPSSPEADTANTPRIARTEDAPLASAASSTRASLPADTLVVRVVDAHEVPRAGIQVEIRVVDSVRVLLSQISDERGEARFTHARAKLEKATAEPGLEIVAPEVFPTPIRVPLNLARDFARGAILRLPDLAELHVRLVDVRGEHVRDGANVWIAVDKVSRRVEEIRDGVAVFSYIEPGTKLSLSASESTLGLSAYTEHPGLTAGERAELVLYSTVDPPLFRGRALDDQSLPLREEPLEVWWRLDAQGFERKLYRVRTAEDGTFAFAPKLGAAGTTHLLELRGKRSSALRRVVDPSWREGPHDLGDVRLLPWPIALAGRVVDARGAAVANAKVRIASGVTLQRVAKEDPALLATDAEGRFAWRRPPFGPLSETAPNEHLAVSAHHARGRCDAVTVKRGSLDLLLTLRSFGEIAGRVALPTGTDPRIVSLVVRESDAKSKVRWERLVLDREGRFAQKLAEGNYDLMLFSGEGWPPLASFERILVPADAASTDSRLDPLRPEEELQVFSFDFDLPAGAELSPASFQEISMWKAWWGEAGWSIPAGLPTSTLGYRGKLVSKTCAQVLAPPGSYVVRIRAARFHMVELLDVSEGQRVALRPE